jgi:hypothetical protein
MFALRDIAWSVTWTCETKIDNDVVGVRPRANIGNYRRVMIDRVDENAISFHCHVFL